MIILTKVSFDHYLFAKELSKAFLWLSKKERTILKRWCFKKFGKHKKRLIIECYSLTNATSNNHVKIQNDR